MLRFRYAVFVLLLSLWASAGVPAEASETADIVATAKPAVIFISHRSATGEMATGTGFVISPQGYALTCAHVVAPERSTRKKRVCTDKVWVRTWDGQTEQARVLYRNDELDIALLDTNLRTSYLALASSDAVQGDEVILLGYPLGQALGKELVVTRGIVSALRLGGSVFQMDAAANPGNSGGPALNADGAVIGVAFARLARYEGMSFAISSSSVPSIEEMIASPPAPDPTPLHDERAANPSPTPARPKNAGRNRPPGRYPKAHLTRADLDGDGTADSAYVEQPPFLGVSNDARQLGGQMPVTVCVQRANGKLLTTTLDRYYRFPLFAAIDVTGEGTPELVYATQDPAALYECKNYRILSFAGGKSRTLFGDGGPKYEFHYLLVTRDSSGPYLIGVNFDWYEGEGAKSGTPLYWYGDIYRWKSNSVRYVGTRKTTKKYPGMWDAIAALKNPKVSRPIPRLAREDILSQWK